jgi:hypothetical protein
MIDVGIAEKMIRRETAVLPKAALGSSAVPAFESV